MESTQVQPRVYVRRSYVISMYYTVRDTRAVLPSLIEYGYGIGVA